MKRSRAPKKAKKTKRSQHITKNRPLLPADILTGRQGRFFVKRKQVKKQVDRMGGWEYYNGVIYQCYTEGAMEERSPATLEKIQQAALEEF